MRTAVDMENLRFTHVHPDLDILTALVYLEGAGLRCVRFENTDSPLFLSVVTTLDLRLLYRNTTGQEPPPHFKDLEVRELLAQLVDAMPPRDVVQSELDTQIARAEHYLRAPDRVRNLLYVKGSDLPAERMELFPLTATPNPKQFTAAAQLAPQRRKPHPAPNAPATPAPRPAPAMRARASSVRPQVWAVADEMWKAAGSPMDKDTVLELRKLMMDRLESERGIKRTSASTALGGWMKERLG